MSDGTSIVGKIIVLLNAKRDARSSFWWGATLSQPIFSRLGVNGLEPRTL